MLPLKLKIAIAGGSGFIGQNLARHLSSKGYEVVILSRHTSYKGTFSYKYWNPYTKELDPSAFHNTGILINLSGSGIAEKRWTASRKKELLSSRIDSTRFLLESVKKMPFQALSHYIGISGIGYYGDCGNTWAKEEQAPGSDFLAQCCQEWEKAHQLATTIGIAHTSILRLGMVLGKNGGAFPKLSKPVLYGVGASLGSGQQYQSWIHIADLCALIEQLLLSTTISGTFNACAPQAITNAELTKAIARAAHRPLFLPNVPAALLRLGLGEMADVLLASCRADAEKLVQIPFQFRYPDIDSAVRELLAR